MLARMRRPYTIGDYAALVDDIRARMPAASIGSDVIVGFPGEQPTRSSRSSTAYLERSPLTHVHVFPYSDRPGTEATAMDEKVPGAIVRERGRRIREIGQRLTTRFRASQVGTIRRGLTLEDGSLVVTDNYLKVRIPPGRSSATSGCDVTDYRMTASCCAGDFFCPSTISWPQAARMSRPRLLRTDTRMCWSARICAK